jgi:ELWxxDGT repeat protein
MARFRPFVEVHEVVFFAADDGVHGTALWTSNSTSDGTVLVKDINPGVAGAFLTPFAVAAAKDTSGNVANPHVQAGRMPLQNGDSSIRRTSDVVLRTSPRKSGNQKTAALDALFAWNPGNDVFDAF